MEHALVIFENGVVLVTIKIQCSLTILRKDEIDGMLDAYAKQYAYPREGLTGVYVPLVEVDLLDFR